MSDRLPILAASIFMHQGRRPAQEDHALIVQEQGVFAVADGFGGPGPGGRASRQACESVRDFLIKEAGDAEATMPFVLRSYYSLAGNVLFNALVHANRKLILANRAKSVHEKGGASLLAAYLDGDLLAIGNIGACTAWLLRQGEARELLVPRTFGRLRDPFGRSQRLGSGTPLTAAGIAEDLEPEIAEVRVQAGDWLLLHTDGITETVRRELLVAQSLKLRTGLAADAAVKALRGGSYDDNAAASLVIF